MTDALIFACPVEGPAHPWQRRFDGVCAVPFCYADQGAHPPPRRSEKGVTPAGLATLRLIERWVPDGRWFTVADLPRGALEYRTPFETLISKGIIERRSLPVRRGHAARFEYRIVQ